MDIASTTSGGHKLWIVGVAIDLYKGGDLLPLSFVQDQEHIPDTSGVLVALPPGSRVYTWLWSGRRRCLSVSFSLCGHQSSCCHELSDVLD